MMPDPGQLKNQSGLVKIGGFLLFFRHGEELLSYL